MNEPNRLLFPIIRPALDPDFAHAENRQRIHYSNGREVRESVPARFSYGWKTCVVNPDIVAHKILPCSTSLRTLKVDWVAKLEFTWAQEDSLNKLLVLRFASKDNLSEEYQTWVEAKLKKACDGEAALQEITSNSIIGEINRESESEWGLSVGGEVQPAQIGLLDPVTLERSFSLKACDCNRRFEFAVRAVLHSVNKRAVLAALLPTTMEAEMKARLEALSTSEFSVDALLIQEGLSKAKAKIEEAIAIIALDYGRTVACEDFVWVNRSTFRLDEALPISDETGFCALGDGTTELRANFSGTATLDSTSASLKFTDETKQLPAASIEFAVLHQLTKRLGTESLRSIFESRRTIASEVLELVALEQRFTGYLLTSLSFRTSIDNMAAQQNESIAFGPEPFPTSFPGSSIAIGATVELRYYKPIYESFLSSSHFTPAQLTARIQTAIAATAALLTPIRIAVEWEVPERSGEKAVRTLFQDAIRKELSDGVGLVISVDVTAPGRRAALELYDRFRKRVFQYKKIQISLPGISALISMECQLDAPRSSGWDTTDEEALYKAVEAQLPRAFQTALKAASEFIGDTTAFKSQLKFDLAGSLNENTMDSVPFNLSIADLVLHSPSDLPIRFEPEPFPTAVDGSSVNIGAIAKFQQSGEGYNRSLFDPTLSGEVSKQIRAAIERVAARLTPARIYREWEAPEQAGDQSTSRMFEAAISGALEARTGSVISLSVDVPGRSGVLSTYKRFEHQPLDFHNIDITLDDVPVPLAISVWCSLARPRNTGWGQLSESLEKASLARSIERHISSAFIGAMTAARPSAADSTKFMEVLMGTFETLLDTAVSSSVPFHLKTEKVAIHPAKEVVAYYHGIQRLKEQRVNDQLEMMSEYLKTIKHVELSRLEAIRTGNTLVATHNATVLRQLRVAEQEGQGVLEGLKCELNAVRGVLGLIETPSSAGPFRSNLLRSADGATA